MPWMRLRVSLGCGSCEARIPEGAVAYMTKAGWPFCATCGVRVMREPAPMDLPELEPIPTPVVKIAGPADFSRFDPRGVAERLQQPLLDVRQRQAGERDA